MPTYVYKFVDSGETIEVQQAFADDALTEAEHPQTGERLPVKKVFTPVGVTFKGGGFYKTDSRKGSSKSSKSKDGGSASDRGSSGEVSSAGEGSSSSAPSSSSDRGSSSGPSDGGSTKTSDGASKASSSSGSGSPAKTSSGDN